MVDCQIIDLTLITSPFLCLLGHRFRKVSATEGFAVVRHMLQSTFQAGREWEPINEQQVSGGGGRGGHIHEAGRAFSKSW